ncbi:MAG TPA: cytidine deaminase [Bacteroidia bacterium]|jgi:cytidine deaminase|nr:cytidine deaminase [Bacteroidia bacterium]
MSTNKLQYVVSVDVFDSEKQTPPEDLKLFKEAEKAMHNAYAPYSDFKVGAAVLLENGKVFTGNNQENAAYPSGLCAERVAIFYAASQYPGIAVKSMAIVCNAQTTHPVTPCGACRQVIAEYEQLSEKKIRVVFGTAGGKIYAAHGIETFLPFMFSKNYLKK